jgi:class 3 adenylate cyclase/DNA-binding CsgD family transcriptional regulator
VRFVGRGRRAAAEARIRALDGTPCESDAGPLVAVFEDPDETSRSVAAVEAGLAVMADAAAQPDLITSVAIGAGAALVGSTRVDHEGESRWAYGAEGEPVHQAVELARAAGESGVVASGAAARALRDRFVLEPTDDGSYRVLAPAARSQDPAPPADSRRIVSILVTDIVGSTRILERVGDRAWGELVDAHERTTRSQLVVFGGREINTTGDGFIAAFDTPALAIRCALALIADLRELGLRIRAGVHSGEVEYVDERAHGIAINVATRVATLAVPGEVLVSATTRELAAGSQLAFSDRGEHVLAGVSEPRRLYAAVAIHAPAPAAPAGTAEDTAAGLTARELDVLRLVAAGLSDAEAAEQLFLSVRTVHAHLRSIYRKLGVRSRAAAGRLAHENGLL